MKKENENQLLSNDTIKIDEDAKHEFSEKKFWECLNDDALLGEVCVISNNRAQLFISGIYNSSTYEIAYGYVYFGFTEEIHGYNIFASSYFDSLFSVLNRIDASDIVGELYALCKIIKYCTENYIHDAIIYYKYEESIHILKGQIFPDIYDLSGEIKELMEDAEELSLTFTRIWNEDQTTFSNTANQLAKRAIMLGTHPGYMPSNRI